MNEQLRAEETLAWRLRASEERFELAVRCTNDGIWDWNLITGDVYYSPRWKSMLGYEDGEIGHRYEEWESRVHPDDLPGTLAAIDAHLRGRMQSYQVEFRMRHKDGSYRWILARGASLRNERGEPYRMAGSHTDITDRKRADEELRLSEMRFRMMMEQSPLAMQIFSPEGRFLQANSAWERLWSLTREQIPQYSPLQDPQLREAGHLPYIERGFAGETIGLPAIRYEPERTIPGATDVPYRWVRGHIYPVKDEAGRILEVVLVYEDITEQKQAEEQLKAAYGILEQGVQERTRELSTLLDLSHTASSTLELQPLLSHILGGLRDVVDYDGASLLLVDGEDFVLFHRQGRGGLEQLGQRRIPVQVFGPAWELFRTGRPLIIDDVRADEPMAAGWRMSMGELADTALGYIRGWMGVPMVLKDRLLGLLAVSSSKPHQYSERDARLTLAIAQQAAIAVENARLYEQAQRWAATEERARLARDLHDSVTQALFSMTLHARSTHMQLEREGIDPASPLARNVQHLSELTRGALAEMRALLFELRPGALRGEGLVAALRQLGAAVGTRYGLPVEVAANAEWVALDGETEEGLYRLAQETLHNAARQGQASRILLRVDETAEGVRIRVTDDGAGLDSAPSSDSIPTGLVAMLDRAAKIGASLEVISNPGAGTTVLITVPRVLTPFSAQEQLARR